MSGKPSDVQEPVCVRSRRNDARLVADGSLPARLHRERPELAVVSESSGTDVTKPLYTQYRRLLSEISVLLEDATFDDVKEKFS